MSNTTIKTEESRSILGVIGKAHNVIAWPDEVSEKLGRKLGLANQTWITSRTKGDLQTTVKVTFDDNCKNGHNTFHIMGTIKRDNVTTCGCIHEEIAKVFPKLAPLIKWHGTSSDTPLHYIANTVFHAGNRDYWGLRKGEAHPGEAHQETRVRFGTSPITHPMKIKFAAWVKSSLSKGTPFFVLAVPHKDKPGDTYKFEDKFTFEGFPCEWYQCPFDTFKEANEWREALQGVVEFTSQPTLFGEGKARELDFARSSAVWPEATDEELMQEPEELTKALQARLPALMAAFKHDMTEVCGFIWGVSK